MQILRLIGWLFSSCIGCILITVSMMIIKDDKTGSLILQKLLANDLYYANSIWLSSLLAKIDIPSSIIYFMHEYKKFQIFKIIQPILFSLVLGVKLVVVQLYLLFQWSLLWLLLATLALIDGLVQRAIRRISVARESAFIHSHAKTLANLCCIFNFFIILAVPLAASQKKWIFLVIMTLHILLVQLATKQFKKYL